MQCATQRRSSNEGQRAQGLQDISTYARLFAEHYKQELEDILLHPDVDRHFGIPLNCVELASSLQRLEVVQELVADPQGTIAVLDEAFRLAQEHVVQECQGNSENMTIKGLVHARVHSLPYYMDPQSPDLSPAPSCISACHNGKLVTIAGNVVRAKAMQLFRAYKLVQCTKCSTTVRLTVCVSNPDEAEMPEQCPNQNCSNTGFKPIADDSVGYTNFQEINITDTDSSEGRARLPGGFPVVLLHDLVDAAQVGDVVEVTGVIRQQTMGQIGGGGLAGLKLILVAYNVAQVRRVAPIAAKEKSSDAFFEQFWQENGHNRVATRNRIVSSVCPQLCNVFDPKLALLLVLLGGVQGMHNGSNVRGNCHMLLIGDPGVGKSQLMKFAGKLAARSVATTGRGTSHAGLTAAAVKVGQQWTLQAGAMPLADGGTCCIDEFGDVPSSEQSALLEAMEQQTISVAKAGLVTKLNARTSVLAAMNPVAVYDANKSVEANTGISGPLVSRFDVVMVLQDLVNPDRDASVADHLLELPTEAEPGSQRPQTAAMEAHWTPEQLCAYISWARRTLAPVVTPAARDILQAYFQHQRAAAAMCGGRIGQERVTVRLLEAMVRLSQAHARLLGKAVVTAQDATAVVLLIDGCAHVTRLLSQITGGGGGSGWGLCRSCMSSAELEHAQRSLLERLDLEESPPSDYESEPLPPEPVHAFSGGAAGGLSRQGQIQSQHRQPHSASAPQARAHTAAQGRLEPPQRPRGLLARKIADAGGGRSSAPAPLSAGPSMSARSHAFAPQASRAPSAPAVSGDHRSIDRQLPASGGVLAPAECRSIVARPLQPSQVGGSQLNAATGTTARQGAVYRTDDVSAAVSSQQDPAAGQLHAAGSAPAGAPIFRTGWKASEQPTGGGQAHDRMNPASFGAVDRAAVISAVGVAQARPAVVERQPARSGVHSACNSLPRQPHGPYHSSSVHSRAIDPRVGSAPAETSVHVLKNVQNRLGPAAHQSVGMEVVGQKRPVVHNTAGQPPIQVRASAPALRFPEDDEEVDISGLL